MPRNFMKIPKKACLMNGVDDGRCAFSIQQTVDDAPKVTILGYSGGVIENHWWWGNLIISTEGMSFPKDTYPVLIDHDTDRRIGFSQKPTIGKDGSLSIEVSQVLDNDEATRFIADSKAGFPFQASIRVRPTKIRQLDKGDSMFVNGREFVGPGTVFVESTYQEVSACVFGWDSNTSSAAFADDADSISAYVYKEEENTMSFNVEEWKKEDPQGYAAFCESVRKEAAAPLEAELAKKNEAIAELTKANEEGKSANNALEARLAKLERDNALRTENDRRAAFSKTIADAATCLPEHLRGKFARMFNIEDYRTEGGDIDAEKLSAAIAKEKEEWQSAFSAPSAAVIGGGRPAEQTTELSAAMSDEEYARLLGNCKPE